MKVGVKLEIRLLLTKVLTHSKQTLFQQNIGDTGQQIFGILLQKSFAWPLSTNPHLADLGPV